MKVLIVDDSPTMRRIHLNSLKGIDSEVQAIQAGDGQEGLEKLVSEGGVDLILVDWNMPRMNGLEFIKKVSSHENLRGIPIIMITSNNERSNVIEAIKAGARNYLVKPYSRDMLQARIRQVLPDQEIESESGTQETSDEFRQVQG